MIIFIKIILNSGAYRGGYYWGGAKLIVWPTQKIDPGQLVIVILLEPFHH